ncbi:MAG TPA: hypothetical protein VK815_10885 [Candidatus Acidoferrales bacterium]|jgi:hypothetical protein|nr:hypothetical protein [Candidatus Acidoferrales bacterium]
MNKTITRKGKPIIVLACSTVVLAMLVFLLKDFVGGERTYHVEYVDFDQVRLYAFDANSQIRALLVRNPTNDASSAFNAGDRRFVGVFSIGVDAPGVEALEKTNSAFIDSNGVKVICGTTEILRSQSSKELNLAAYKYASDYNRCLLGLLLKSSDVNPTR